MPLADAAFSSRTSTGAKGRQMIAPTAQQVHVTCSADIRLRTGFSATTPTAEEAAATIQRITPATGAWWDVVATPISTTPANASMPPRRRLGVVRSFRKTAASATTMIGAINTSIAAVPASTRRSASFNTML